MVLLVRPTRLCEERTPLILTGTRKKVERRYKSPEPKLTPDKQECARANGSQLVVIENRTKRGTGWKSNEAKTQTEPKAERVSRPEQ